jgi:hypothetical protein
MKKVLYIVEGETERRFFRFLQQKEFIQPGKIAVFNLMQEPLKPTNNILTSKIDRAYCVLDTDCVEKDNLVKLMENRKQLQQICSKNKIYLLIQNRNFEDELRCVFSCKKIGKFLKLKNTRLEDVKRYLAQQIDYKGYISCENIKRYGTRSSPFKQRLIANGMGLLDSVFIDISKCR